MHWIMGVVLSVVLTFFSFPPFPLGPVMFVALVPIFIAMETAPTWKAAFFRTWVYVFLGNSAICFWVAHTMHHFARLPWILSYPSVGVLSVFEQSAWPLMAALRFGLHRGLGLRPLFWTPACLFVLDFAWPKFFPNTLGNVLYATPWLAQFADFTGVWGITAIMVMTNELLAMGILKAWPKEILRKHAIASAAVLAAFLAYSTVRYFQIQTLKQSPRDRVKIAIVQPNVNAVAEVRARPDKDRARVDSAQAILRMSREAAALRPELIFWPETAVSNTFRSSDPRETKELTALIEAFQRESGIPLLFGARDKRDGKLFNALYYLPAGDVYHKHVLLFMGEHIPFSGLFPSFADYIVAQGGTAFTAGPGPQLLRHPKARLGPMICLEGLYAGYVRDIALTGADLLVNATNDAWFGPGLEPALHLYLTAFRSIETRRPLVRSTTTGYSAVVDIDGSLRHKTELDQAALLVDEVPIYDPIETPYLLWGNLWIWLAAVWALLPLRGLWKRRTA